MTSFASAILDSPQRVSVFEEAVPINFVEFDASLSEDHNSTAVVSDHPVEDGGDVTDHIRLEPDTLSMRVIISNHPIIVARSITATPASASGDPNSRAEDGYIFMLALMKSKVVVGVATTLRDYTDLITTSVAVTRDKDTGNIVDMNLSFREISVVTTETVEVPVPVEPARSNVTDLGKKNNVEAEPAVTEKAENDSAAFGIATGVARLFGGG